MTSACCPTRKALEAQHTAIDWLFARLSETKEGFYPSQSPVWPLMVQGYEAMKRPCPCRLLAKLEQVERESWQTSIEIIKTTSIRPSISATKTPYYPLRNVRKQFVEALYRRNAGG